MNIAALAISIVTLAIVLWLAVEYGRLKRKVDVVPEEGGVLAAIRGLDDDLAAVEEVVADLGPRVERLEGRMPFAIQHTAVVEYDAFNDIAGHMSRSIALLNGRGDGIVVTLLVGREDTHWYTKQVRGGEGMDPLSPEEEKVVKEAMGLTMR